MVQRNNGVRPQLNEIYASQRDSLISARRAGIVDELALLENELGRGAANPDSYARIARLRNQLSNQDQALAALRTGIETWPAAAQLHWQLAMTLYSYGRTEEAVAVAASAVDKVTRGLQFRFFECLTVPVIYDTEEEVIAWRRRFLRGLETCEKDVLLAHSEDLRAYLEGFRHALNFDLAYQGYDDLALQRRYGNLVHHILKTRYPQWSEFVAMPDPATDRRIRVGFVSSHFFVTTVGRLLIGWLENLDRERLQIHSYYIDAPEDSMTTRVRDSSDFFFHIPDDFEAVCEQIRKDRLHVLIFVTAKKTTMLAALRLAPAQCTGIGHPLTSGLPTLDYFLSSELMEPVGAQEHYSEELVLLPGIGLCFDKPPIPRALMTKTRGAWGIPEDAVVYLCCQSLVKYLPRHDHIFPEVAQRVAKAKFVFLTPDGLLSGKFQSRLRRAFSAAGLNADDYCVFLPAQHQFDYWNLNLVSDVFLDSLGWSGNMTCLEALACGLPVVTLPGKVMRARHSYAILTQLGITSTIASSEKEYIDIAVRLGMDSAWRAALRKHISANDFKIFSDKRSVRALEEFLENVVTPLQNGHAKSNESENYVDGNQS